MSLYILKHLILILHLLHNLIYILQQAKLTTVVLDGFYQGHSVCLYILRKPDFGTENINAQDTVCILTSKPSTEYAMTYICKTYVKLLFLKNIDPAVSAQRFRC